MLMRPMLTRAASGTGFSGTSRTRSCLTCISKAPARYRVSMTRVISRTKVRPSPAYFSREAARGATQLGQTAKLLGRTTVPAHVVDLDRLVRGEYSANVFRKAFASEMVAIKRAL
jgi:hypothetical protein